MYKKNRLGYGFYDGLYYGGSYGQGSGPLVLDPDAKAYLTAANITDPVIMVAVSNRVISLKFYNLWTRTRLLYPMLGGFSGAIHILKRNSDVAPVATFNNFIASDYDSSKGMTGDGSSKWIDPGFALTGLNNQNISIGMYSRSQYGIGIPLGSAGDGLYMGYATASGGNVVSTIGSSVQPFHDTVNNHVSMTGDASFVKTFSGGLVHNTLPAASNTALTGSLTLFKYGSGFFYNGSVSEFYCLDAMSESEMLTWDAISKTFHTAINRRESNLYVAIGDSITFMNAATDVFHSYAYLLNQSLGTNLRNYGVVGNVFQTTSPVATSGFDSIEEKIVACVLGQSPAYVTVLAGLNDERHNDPQYTAATYKIRMKAKIQSILAGGISVKKICLVSPIYNDPSKFASGSPPFNGGSVQRQTDYRDACAQIAVELGIVYFDAYQYVKDNFGNAGLASDGIHPLDAVHAGLATSIKAAFDAA